MPDVAVLNASATPAEDPHRRIMSNLLIMCQREIETSLRPELSSHYALYVADVMSAMLSLMADWTAGIPYDAIDARRRELAGEVQPGGQDMLRPFSDPAGLDEPLQNAMAQSVARGDADVPAQIARIGQLHDDFITAQKARHAEARERDRTLMASLDIDLTLDLFTSFVRDRLGITTDEATHVRKIPGGNSKDTFLVTMESGGEYIVRRNFPFGPTDTSAPNEFDMLNRLREQGMPVPRPIFAEHGHALGQPALVVEKIEGENALFAANRDPAIGRQVSLELAALLARLHGIDPVDLGLAVSAGDPREQIRAYVAEWRAWWEQHRIQPSSLLEAGFAWLDRNVPSQINRVVPVHGDARPDNMMYHEGEVAALLDWEFLHAGDASEDLQYAKGFVEPFVTWDEFLAAYQAAGGGQVSEESSKFYDVFRSLRNVVCVHVSWAGFVTGKYPSFKLASQGVFFRQMLEEALGKSLAA